MIFIIFILLIHFMTIFKHIFKRFSNSNINSFLVFVVLLFLLLLLIRYLFTHFINLPLIEIYFCLLMLTLSLVIKNTIFIILHFNNWIIHVFNMDFRLLFLFKFVICILLFVINFFFFRLLNPFCKDLWFFYLFIINLIRIIWLV